MRLIFLICDNLDFEPKLEKEIKKGTFYVMREQLLGGGNDYSNAIDHQSTQCHKKNTTEY